MSTIKIINADTTKYLIPFHAFNGYDYDLIYLDPPFNTGKTQRLNGMWYDDNIENYFDFLNGVLTECKYVMSSTGSIFLHLDYRSIHRAKLIMDKIFGERNFMNEIIWCYDYGGRSKKRWSPKHDTILWYTKNNREYTFNYDAMDRIPYEAPGLVGPEKAAKGKVPTDCYSSDTEVLTDVGWKLFDELSEEYNVATVDKNNNIYYVKPTKYIKEYYEGEMIHIKSATVDLLVTPEHNMYLKKKRGKEYDFIKASELDISKQSLYYTFPNRLNYSGNKYKYIKIGKYKFLLNDWLEFVGRYIGDGSCVIRKSRHEVHIACKKDRKIKNVINLLNRMKLHFRQNDYGIEIYSKDIVTHIKLCGRKCNIKEIPIKYMSLDKSHLEYLYYGLIDTDGNINKRDGSHSFLTTSKKLANQVGELMIKLGYKFSISKRKRDDIERYIQGRLIKSNYPAYHITRIKTKESSIWPSRHISNIPYKDYVHCVTVEPYHTLVVKRNGKVAVCGNCWKHTIVHTTGKERTGYPTQKPLGILNRIVKVHSNEGDKLLDPFAGSGSFGESGLLHNRDVDLIDSNCDAFSIMHERFLAHNPEITVHELKQFLVHEYKFGGEIA